MTNLQLSDKYNLFSHQSAEEKNFAKKLKEYLKTVWVLLQPRLSYYNFRLNVWFRSLLSRISKYS